MSSFVKRGLSLALSMLMVLSMVPAVRAADVASGTCGAEKLTIPGSVTYIGDGGFIFMMGLQEITFQGDAPERQYFPGDYHNGQLSCK